MRNGLYTLFKNRHLEIKSIRDDRENVTVRYKGKVCPFKGFSKSNLEPDTFFLIVPINELKNAYEVKTMGEIGNFTFQVFSKNLGHSDKIRIMSREKRAFKQLDLTEVSTGLYLKDVALSSLESLWEERKPTLDLELPVDLKYRKLLQLPK